MISMLNYVLVPGAWLGSWVWKKVTPILEENGHKTYPVTLTGMGERSHLASKEYGIETVIQDVVNVINYNDLDDVVLVGHSFAGKVVVAAADRVPERIHSIIYLDSFWPKKTREPQGGSTPSEEFGELPADSIGLPFSEEILDSIGRDVKGKDKEWMLSKATPWPGRYAEEPITLSTRFDSIKGAHIFCTETGDPVDEIIQGKWGELMGPYRLMDSGHFPMVTKPEELAQFLLELA